MVERDAAVGVAVVGRELVAVRAGGARFLSPLAGLSYFDITRTQGLRCGIPFVAAAWLMRGGLVFVVRGVPPGVFTRG
jgi:hypothetical protein